MVMQKRRRKFSCKRPTYFACAMSFSFMMSGIAAAADGDIDTTFGSAGFIMLNSTMDHSPPIDSQAKAVAIDGSGRIVIAGGAQHFSNSPTDANLLLLRLTPDGNVDAAFAADDGGYRLINFDLTGIGTSSHDTATDVAIQPDGKIAAIGNAYFNDTQSQFAAVRVDDAGTLDATFGGTGAVHFGTLSASTNNARSLVIDMAGNLVFAGFTTYGGGLSAQTYAAVARLTSSGAIDASFYSGYVLQSSLSPPPEVAQYNGATAISLDGAGRILVAGDYCDSSICGDSVQRLTTNGYLDASFAGGAPAQIPPPNYGVNALYAEPDGSFVVCGEGAVSGQSTVYFARFLSDGTADTNFGTNGVTAFPFSGFPSFIARTKRGGWLMAGEYSGEGAFIAKVLADGQPDTTLNGTGLVSVLYQPNTLFDMAKPALTADGKLIVAGTLPEAANNGSGTIGLMRIYADYDTLFVGNFEPAH
jgi:uncharacterized delta-60 repeat protein